MQGAIARGRTLALIVPTAFLLAGALAGQGRGFVPGDRTIFSLDLAGAPAGGLPVGLRVLKGSLELIDKDGARMLRASAPSEFLVQLPELLPDSFTIEFDLIPKHCCAPEDLAFEGTPTVSRGTASANVVWQPDQQTVVGGGELFQAATPAGLRDQLAGQLSKIVVSIQGRTLRLYTNGVRLYTLTDRRFARGSVLRVFLGGQDDDQQAVFLARLRIAAGGRTAIAAAPSSGQRTATVEPTPVTAVTTVAPTTATGMTSTAPAATTPTAPAPAARADGTIKDPVSLLVGVGMSDITGPIAEVGMMGYADDKQKTGGLHTRLYARAFIFAAPNGGKRVVWVNTELAMLFSSVKQGVLRKLAARDPQFGILYTDQNVMISATHTHSGPGGYAHYAMYNITTSGHIQQTYNAIVDGIVEAIVQAHTRLAPGTVSMTAGEVTDETMVNRSQVAFMLDPEAIAPTNRAAPINREMVVLRIESGKRPVGAIVWHAVHNTSMPNSNHLVSSDHKGYAAYLFERQFGSIAPFQQYGDFVAAFPNGAEGDMSPNLNTNAGMANSGPVFAGPLANPFESSKLIGTREFNAAIGLFNAGPTPLGSDVDYRYKTMLMPGTLVPSSNFTNGAGLKMLCTGAYGISFMAGAEDGRTTMPVKEGVAISNDFDFAVLDAMRRLIAGIVTVLVPPLAPVAAGFMGTSSDPCQTPKPVLIPSGALRWTPEILPFQIIRIGTLAIIGVPGEMTMQAGRRLTEAVRAMLLPLGVQRVVITGLANEYSGYITTPEEFVSQQYEGASTLYGRLTFDAYKDAFRDLGVAMASGRPVASGPEQPDLSGAQILSSSGLVERDERPANQEFGQFLVQPTATVGRGSDLRVVYRSGHPNNDLRRNDSYARIERENNGTWDLVAWDGLPETWLVWARDPACPGYPDAPCFWSTMDFHWIVPADAKPGTYHIRVFGKWKNGATQELVPYERTSLSFTVQ